MFNPNYNPGQVMLGNGGQGPYMPTKQPPPFKQTPMPPQVGNRTIDPTGRDPHPVNGPQPVQPGVGAQAVRATGTGAFDPAYRQDLANYAGGNFARPNGNLSFNPTGQLFGNPTGGGSSPLPGMPTDMLSMALGGQPYSSQPPQSAAPKKPWWQMVGDNFMNPKGMPWQQTQTR